MAKYHGTSSKRGDGIAKKKSASGGGKASDLAKNKRKMGASHHRYIYYKVQNGGRRNFIPVFNLTDLKCIFLNFSMNPNRPKESVAKGVANPRSAGTIKRLQMYRCSKVRNNEVIPS